MTSAGKPHKISSGDLDSLDQRVALLELESHARLGHLGMAHYADSAGAKHTLTAAEVSQLVAAVRAKQFRKVWLAPRVAHRTQGWRRPRVFFLGLRAASLHPNTAGRASAIALWPLPLPAGDDSSRFDARRLTSMRRNRSLCSESPRRQPPACLHCHFARQAGGPQPSRILAPSMAVGGGCRSRSPHR
jgi:hypothetical protein